MGFGSGGEPFDVDAMWQGAISGLEQGITSIGIQWLAEELELPPLVGAISANILGSVIEGVLNHQNVFINVGEHLAEGIIGVFTLGGYSNDPWSQAVYISQVLDFAEIVREQGILTAMQTYATSIFHNQTVNMIVQDGGIVDMVTGRAEIRVDPVTGREYKRMWTGYDQKYYLDVDMETGVMLEKMERIDGRDVIIRQKYIEKPDGTIVVDGTEIEEIFDDNTKQKTSYDQQGRHTELIIYDANGNPLFRRSSQTGIGYIPYDENGYPLSCIEEDLVNGLTYRVEGGELKLSNVNIDGTLQDPTYERDPLKTNFENALSFIDSEYSYMEGMFYDSDVLGSDSYSQFL